MLGLANSTDVFLLQEAVKGYAKTQAQMQKEIKELRAACIATDYDPCYLSICGFMPTLNYTAIEAVQMLLKHAGLKVKCEPAKPEEKTLVPVEAASAKRKR